MKVYAVLEEHFNEWGGALSLTTVNTYLYNQHAINDATELNAIAPENTTYWVKEVQVLEREVYNG